MDSLFQLIHPSHQQSQVWLNTFPLLDWQHEWLLRLNQCITVLSLIPLTRIVSLGIIADCSAIVNLLLEDYLHVPVSTLLVAVDFGNLIS